MPKTRKQKEAIVADLKETLSGSTSMVFAQVSGYTMDQANALRDTAKKEGVSVSVTKKTLLRKAAEELGIPLSVETLEGSTLTLVGHGDEIAPARILAAFAKKNESVKISAGFLEGKMVDAETVKAFASLPTRDELLGRMAGSLQSPISGFARVLVGNVRGFVQVLSALKDQKVNA